MKPAPFKYSAPESLDAALEVMQEHGFDAKLLAGGQSLIPMMNFRLAQPSLIVNINGLTELDKIYRDQIGGLRIGAMVRQVRLESDPLVSEFAPLLHETIPYIAHPQIRNRGTLGGSMAHADPAAELPAVAVALGASFRLQSAQGERWVSAEEFFIGLFTTTCGENEILVEVSLPHSPHRTGYAFEEVARRHGDYALAGLAVVLSLDKAGSCADARLVYMNAGEYPIVAREAAKILIGQRPSDPLFVEAAETAAMREISPVGDIHASAGYKRHLAKVLTVRALNRALTKAREWSSKS